MKPTIANIVATLKTTPTLRAAAYQLGVSMPTLRNRLDAMRRRGQLPKRLADQIRDRQCVQPPPTEAEVEARKAAASVEKQRADRPGVYAEIRAIVPLWREGDMIVQSVTVAASVLLTADDVIFGRNFPG